MVSHAEWVAVDWGTSNVRAWGIAADGSQSFASAAEEGMGRITRGDYPIVLAHLIAGRLHEGDVVICGMAGARQGWIEAPYIDTPADLRDLLKNAAAPPEVDKALNVRILPGVCQRQPGREDVMRGEETQLLGLLRLRPGFSGTAVLPGTHSKWAEIRDGRLVRFSSAMTGELFEVLKEDSVLRYSLQGERGGPANDTGLEEGLDTGLARPDLVTGLMFRTRAAGLLSGRGADWCSGYLSGLLIGAEIGGHRDWIDGQVIPLVGSPRLTRIYARAFAKIGVSTTAIAAAEATIAGLMEARAQ